MQTIHYIYLHFFFSHGHYSLQLEKLGSFNSSASN